jgi:hypothetical protein
VAPPTDGSFTLVADELERHEQEAFVGVFAPWQSHDRLIVEKRRLAPRSVPVGSLLGEQSPNAP